MENSKETNLEMAYFKLCL